MRARVHAILPIGNATDTYARRHSSLIDPKSLDSILSMSLGSIIEGMEKMSLRETRPGYQGPSRQFDVDLEEIMEWLIVEKSIRTSHWKNKTFRSRRKQSFCYYLSLVIARGVEVLGR